MMITLSALRFPGIASAAGSLGCAIFALGLMACGPEVEAVGFYERDFLLDGLGAESMVLVGIGTPVVHVNSHEVTDGAESSRPLYVGGDAAIEFVPISEDEGVQLQCYAVTQDSEELLWEGAPWVVESADLQGEPQLQNTTKPIRVELDDVAGERVRLRWRVAGAKGPVYLGGLRWVQERGAGQERPDVLLVCSDTHRYDFSLGHPGTELMPRTQAFLGDAVRYHRTYTTASWTLPSISSALSGLYPLYHQTGLRTSSTEVDGSEPLEAPPGFFPRRMGKKQVLITTWPDDIDTIGDHLYRKGYSTRAVVSNPLYLLSGIYGDGQELVVDTGLRRGPEIVEAARGMIMTRDRERPLFLVVHFMDAHEWHSWYRENTPEGAHPEPAEIRAEYTRAVRALDAAVADLVALWDEEVGRESSLVAFFSDHGESLRGEGEGKRVGHGNSVAEELLHVPLAIRYPSSLGVPARDEQAPAGLVDLLPTVLHVLGEDPGPREGGGVSLLNPMAQERVLHSDFQLYGNEVSTIRNSQGKLVLDHTADSQFLEDGAGQAAAAEDAGEALVELLQATWRSHRDKAKVWSASFRSDRRVRAEEASQALRALGYGD